jgi:hypothetical protein
MIWDWERQQQQQEEAEEAVSACQVWFLTPNLGSCSAT